MAVHAMTGFGVELRRLMAERGLSLRETARRVPCDSGYLSKVASGRKTVSADLAARLDDVLAAEGALSALAASSSPGIADGDLDLIELGRRVEASDLGSGTLELLGTAVDGMCRDYPVADALDLSAQARRHLRYVTGLLGGRVTLAQHRELLVLGGWLSALMACTCYDLGDRAAADMARRMTAQFAGHAGHGELTAWSFETAAWFALVEGRYRDTVALSEAGMEHAGVTSAGVQLALQAARGHARMGDVRAKQALRAGRVILDRLPVPGHPEHHFVFDGGKYEFYVGTVLTWLGSDDAAAAAHARYVVSGGSPAAAIRWPMRVAISKIDLAVIASRRGDLDEAVALGTQALGYPRRSAQLLPRAAELGRNLAARYPGERLSAEYGEILVGQRRALPPA